MIHLTLIYCMPPISNKKFIAILGGSFDPIHLGHLSMATIACNQITNTEVYFVPCGNPVHRSASTTSARDRCYMVQLAIKNQPHFHLSTYEIDRTEPSYTIDTLKHFRLKFPDNPLGFIMGMDTFSSLDTKWGENWRDLVNYAHLLIVPRAGNMTSYSADLRLFVKKHQQNKEFLHKFLHGGIIVFDETPIEVSSTEIRNTNGIHQKVSPLLPKGVYDYIQQQHLYR